MRLSRSLRWKVLVTLVAAAAFVWLLEATMFDSRFSMLPLSFERGDPTVAPVPGARVAFTSTAYCKGLVTSSGVAVQKGVMAADPAILPVGSVIDFSVEDPRYDGIYTILDTGPEIKGREVDVYMWSCYEALAYGRRVAQVTLLRLGWTPDATTPTLMDRIFRRPTHGKSLPSRPLPIGAEK